MTGADNTMPNPALIRLIALIAYPALIGIALAVDQPSLRALGLPLLAIALVGLRPAHWPGRALLLASFGLALLVLLAPTLALWPPGLICLATAAWFAQSLLPGRQPLIARFAAVVEAHRGEPLPPDSAGWLRGWTWAWAGLLSGLGATAIVLAARDQASLWLLWVSAVIPGTVLVTLIAEYLLRRLRFPAQDHWSLGQFLMLLSRIRPEHLAR
jgi:uncharacterized membrane protein